MVVYSDGFVMRAGLLGRQRCKPCKKHFRKRMKGGKQMRGAIGLKISNERYTDRKALIHSWNPKVSQCEMAGNCYFQLLSM